jgi:hypothetical protein
MESTQLYRNHGKHSLTYKPNILEMYRRSYQINVGMMYILFNDDITIYILGGCKRDLAAEIFITKYTVDVYVKDFYF